jgi:hypothetical protein
MNVRKLSHSENGRKPAAQLGLRIVKGRRSIISILTYSSDVAGRRSFVA